jgi:sterol 3beta-glucosyltransferase
MRIALLTWGTRGDVQPYVALACELIRRGHRVRFCANVDLLDWVRRAGIEDTVPIPMNLRALLDTERARGWLAAGRTTTFMRWLGDVEHQQRHEIAAALLSACEGADAIAASFFVGYRAHAIAEKLDVPMLRISPFPGPVTGEWPSAYLMNGVPRVPFALLRRASHRLFLHVIDRAARPDVAELRRELGARELDGGLIEDDFEARVGTAGIWSGSVLPRPADWPANAQVTGYCFLPKSIRERVGEGTPERLARWLAAGSPPVFFGFGSMPVLEPEKMLDDVRIVARRIGVRALVGAGWTSYAHAGDDDVLIEGAFDHDAVLPRCRAAVHHGGAGTTAAVLRAGIPAVVCSVFADQGLWGHRVAKLGTGVTLPFQKLDAKRLQHALGRAMQDDVVANAAAVAKRVQSEDGVAITADTVERSFGHRSTDSDSTGLRAHA